MELITLSQVSKQYKQGGIWLSKKTVYAVKNISLSIRQGQCTMLVGASGSGKSTLGRLVLGVEKPHTGSINYKGKPLHQMDEGERKLFRRQVQVVFQNSFGAVNPRFTAQKIIAEPLINYTGLKDTALIARVIELLEQVGLNANAMSKLPHQFSGGELQRICIARALALSPELIVLDEAVSSLDVLNQSRIMDLLAKIKSETKTSFLFITHDLRIAGKFADALAIMEEGELAYYAPNMQNPDVLQSLCKNGSFKRLAEAIYPPLPPESKGNAT